MLVVIHAHYYQPPRGNPWSGRVPRQESALPAHDWNERITDECYRPNARSRVLGRDNRIDEIVNNYAVTSFDFGPTLLGWLESAEPGVYKQIIEGDRLGAKLQDGHGNAIAHVYNHVIMPLANYRDKRTQIVWGLRDFEWRFGRKSESIWLAETAINLETVKVLIDFGMRYIILSPHQALRVRPLDRSRGWTDVSGGKIDPRRPYRFFLKDSRRHRIRSRYIDIFFYDGQLAADISFAHLLRSGPALAERLLQAGADLDPEKGLVSVATDGEVYGHHEPFGDMCLSSVIRREAPRRGIRFTNYGRYLDRHPAEHEVELNFGDHDEGTAWSCAHGVGRWEGDCGCSTGAGPGWNQRWRTPLRRGFDMIRDRLIETYLEQISPLVDDPWATRDDYILVLLDPGAQAREAFMQQHARKELGRAERQKLWRLLESQRFAMYMFTSCGWFFADISGIETVQNMAYACRAIELAQPWQRLDLEKMLLEYLGEASSNIPEMGTGADVYRGFIPTQRIRPQEVAGGLALGAAIQDREPERQQFRYEARTIQFQRREEAQGDRCVEASYHGLIELVHRDTEERSVFEVHVYRSSPAEIRCYVLPGKEDGSAEEVSECFPGTPSEAAVRDAEGVQVLNLRDLVAEDRESIILTAYESILEKQENLLMDLFNEGRGLMVTCRAAGVPVPAVMRAAAAHVLTRMLAEKAGQLEAGFLERLRAGPESAPTGVSREVAAKETSAEAAAKGTSAEATEALNGLLSEIGALLNFSRENELEVSVDSLTRAYGGVLTLLLKKLQRQPDPLWAEQCVEVIQSSYQLKFPLDRRPVEDLAFLVLGKHRASLLEYAREEAQDGGRRWRAFQALADALHLNIHWILEQDNGKSSSPGAADQG